MFYNIGPKFERESEGEGKGDRARKLDRCIGRVRENKWETKR